MGVVTTLAVVFGLIALALLAMSLDVFRRISGRMKKGAGSADKEPWGPADPRAPRESPAEPPAGAQETAPVAPAAKETSSRV